MSEITGSNYFQNMFTLHLKLPFDCPKAFLLPFHVQLLLSLIRNVLKFHF